MSFLSWLGISKPRDAPMLPDIQDNVRDSGNLFVFGIANTLLNQGIRVKWLTAMQIVERSCFYSEAEYAEYIRSITAPDLLIIDDLGAERGTDFALERVHSLMDTRISANKPMIVTTNIDITDMGNCADLKKKRTFDRIMPMQSLHCSTAAKW